MKISKCSPKVLKDLFAKKSAFFSSQVNEEEEEEPVLLTPAGSSNSFLIQMSYCLV